MYFTEASKMREVTKNSFYSVVCGNAFDVAVKINQAANNGDSCVSLVFAMPEHDTRDIIQELEEKGYKVNNTQYPSTGNGFEIDWSKW